MTEVARFAKEKEADMIVVGTHGRTGNFANADGKHGRRAAARGPVSSAGRETSFGSTRDTLRLDALDNRFALMVLAREGWRGKQNAGASNDANLTRLRHRWGRSPGSRVSS